MMALPRLERGRMERVRSKLSERTRRVRAKLAKGKVWFVAALGAITANAAASELKTALDSYVFGCSPADFRAVVVHVGLFAANVYWLYRLRGLLFYPRTRLRQNETPPKREHLIVF